MIVVCKCGQKNRVTVGRAFADVRCGKCRVSLGDEARRQADRNALIVLDLAAILLAKEDEMTKSERAIAKVIAHHELETK